MKPLKKLFIQFRFYPLKVYSFQISVSIYFITIDIMDKFRRVIASISMVAILSTFVVSATAFAAFSDVPSNEWFAPYVSDLETEGLVSGSKFNPATNLTRADAAVWLVGKAGLTADVPSTATFKDVPKGHYAFSAVETAYKHGVVSGYSHKAGYFGPNDPITREQYAKMASEAFGLAKQTDCSAFSDSSSIASWACEYVATVYHWSVVDGYPNGSFGPGNNINRAEGSKMTVKAASPVARTSTPKPVSGDLTVSLSSSTAAGATLPASATSVPVATWNFKAGSKSATLSSLTVKRYGVATLASDHQVYLYDGSNRLSSGKTINSTTNLATFGNLNLSIPAGSTKTLTVRMDVGATGTTGEFGLEVEKASSVTAGGNVGGSFPVRAEKFSLSTISGGTVTMTKNGTVTNAKVGEKGATVAKFKIAAASEKASVQELGLYFSGTVSTDDVQNFKLYGAGKSAPLAEVSSLNSKDVAHFILDTPYEISKGDTRTFYVTAEFNSGRSGDTVLVYLDETTDIVAIGDKYGYGMGVTATAYDGSTCSTVTPTECNAMTLQGGDITISGTTITNRDVAVNQEDVSILKFSITSESAATFNNFAIQLTATESSDTDSGLLNDSDSDSANFTDIKVSETSGGGHVWGPIDADVLKNTSVTGSTMTESNDGAAAYHLFTDDLVMAAGETKDFELTVDVENNAALADQTLTAAVFIDSSYPEIKDVNNKILTNASSLVPTSTYTGDAFTVKSESLTISRSSSVGSATKVIGEADFPMSAFSFSAGDASDVKVTSLSLTGYVDADGTANSGAFVAGVETKYFNEMILSLNIYKGSVSEANKINATAKAATTAGVIAFEDLDWTIAAGQTELLIVTGSLANNSAYNNYAAKVDLADVSADITAENEDGNSVTATGDGVNGTTTDSSSYTHTFISSGGTLSADVPTNVPASQIAVAGTTGNEFTKIRFTSARESFTVDKLFLRNDANTSVGDYDDNLASVKLKYYTDNAQTQEATSTCSQSSAGYYTCTGLAIRVPDPDLTGVPDYTDVTVMADLTGVANDQADEGDKPSLQLALNDFEATGLASGSKVTEASLTITDASAAGAGSDTGLDLGSTMTTSTTAITADASATSAVYPGDLMCVDVDDSATSCAALELMYVKTVSGTTINVVRAVNGTTAAAYTAAGGNDSLLTYGQASILAANYLQVQATDLDLAASSSTRTGSTSATEAVMSFTMTADSAKDARFRQGVHSSATMTEGTDTAGRFGVAAVTTAGQQVDGSATKVTWTGAGQSASTIYNDLSSGNLSTYSRASFWVLYHDNTGSDALDASDVTLMVNEGGDALTDHELALDGTGSSLSSDPAEDVWTFVDMPLPSGTTSSDTRIGFDMDADALSASSATASGDYIIFDQLRVYNEKINIDLTLNENWSAVTPTVAYLKQNGTVVATGYADFDQVASSKTGQITFTPVGTYGEIVVNGTDTFVVEMDTNTAISDDASATEKLTATIDLGNVSTTSDVYWNDYSGIINFLGVSSTDKIQTTSSY